MQESDLPGRNFKNFCQFWINIISCQRRSYVCNFYISSVMLYSSETWSITTEILIRLRCMRMPWYLGFVLNNYLAPHQIKHVLGCRWTCLMMSWNGMEGNIWLKRICMHILMYVFLIPSIKKYTSLFKSRNDETSYVFDVKYTSTYTKRLYHYSPQISG